MTDVPVRELRNHTAAVLRRVEAGERMRITVDRRPVAELVPLPSRETWVPSRRAEAAQAGLEPDPELADLIAEELGSTLEDEA